jgi:glycosyltransferase involved in cell wall biosynthesis
LEECDVFVLPSLYEGFSYAILEAMAARLPIVTTDVFGVQETVAQVPGNVIVPPGNPDALARGMKRMAVTWLDSSRKALGEIGQANHDYARLRFTQSETMRQTVEIYRELCEQVRKG